MSPASMDVRCEQCATEYEFDDALVSERGTTVKCTNCGFQFKVYRPGASRMRPDRWSVRKVSGEALDFTSLRELQRAILAKEVGEDDSLSRPGGPPRSLRAIPELTPFFEAARTRNIPGPRRPAPTPPGGVGLPVGFMDGTTEASIATPLNPALLKEAAFEEDPTTIRRPSDPPPPVVDEDRPTKFRGTVPMPTSAAEMLEQISDEEPATIPIDRFRAAREEEPPTLKKPAEPIRADVDEASAQLDASFAKSREPELFTPTPADIGPDSRNSLIDSRISEPQASTSRGRRSGVARWVFAVVLLGTGGLLAAAYGKKLFADRAASATPSSGADAKLSGLLAAAETHRKAGRFDEAYQAYLKASALAEQDPRVVLGLARLETQRADVHWLRLRALPKGKSAARTAAASQLKAASAQAAKRVAQLEKAKISSKEALQVRVDAKRLAGELDVAQSLSGKLANSALDPASAYALAVLEFARGSKNLPKVIEGLKLAVKQETPPGRAHAALVLALAAAKQDAQAQEVLEAMAGASPIYPVYPDLQVLVGGESAKDAKDGKRSKKSGTDKKSAKKSTKVAAPPPATAPPQPGATAAAPPAATHGNKDGGEFSEGDLNKDIGAKPPVVTTTTKTVEKPPEKKAPPAPKPTKTAAPPAIDTSDLPPEFK